MIAKELIRKIDSSTNYIVWQWTKDGSYDIISDKKLVRKDYEVVEVSANKLGEISIQVKERE